MTTMLQELDEVLGFELDSEVIGKDTRVRVKDTTLEPFRYICQLEVDGQWWGTGTLIGPRTVLTSGRRVIPKSQRSQMRVIPGRNGEAEPFGYAMAARLIPMEGFRGQSSEPRMDVGIIQLDRRIGDQIGWWTASHTRRKGERGTSILRGSLPMPAGQLKVHLSGYPIDKPEACTKRTCGSVQYDAYDDTEKRNDGMLYYANDTYAGNDGSPVWVKRSPDHGGNVLVGIHQEPEPPGKRGRNWAVFIDANVRKFIIANTK